MAIDTPLQSGVKDFKEDFNAGNKDAVTREVGKNETVSNQLTDLTSSNSKYIQTARNNANAASAERGMLMSSVGAGAAEKAAIESALPIAQQDASTYANTAKDNMDAQNTDAQNDQSQYRGAAGQQQQLEANAVEADKTRDFTTTENNTQRDFTAGQAGLDRDHQSSMAGQEQGWRSGEAQLDRDASSAENQANRDWQTGDNALGREFDANKQQNQIGADAAAAAKAADEARQNSYFAMLAQRETNMNNVLNSIYSNTNLTPAQQQQAAQNAMALNTSISNSYNSVFAQGIPPIFRDPYAMNTGGGAAAPPAAQVPANPPYTNAVPVGGGGGGTTSIRGGSGGLMAFTEQQLLR